MSELPRSGWRGLPPWIRGLTLLGLVIAVLSVPLYFLARNGRIARNERAAIAVLKMLAAAQDDFRANDRDGNRIQDFWTGDIAGLLAIPGGPPINPLIAAADTAPQVPGVKPPAPYHGYFFRVMLTDETGQPYRQDTGGVGAGGRKLWNRSKFAICAYPARPDVTGRYTYVVNEANAIFRMANGGRPLDASPEDEQLGQTYTQIE